MQANRLLGGGDDFAPWWRPGAGFARRNWPGRRRRFFGSLTEVELFLQTFEPATLVWSAQRRDSMSGRELRHPGRMLARAAGCFARPLSQDGGQLLLSSAQTNAGLWLLAGGRCDSGRRTGSLTQMLEESWCSQQRILRLAGRRRKVWPLLAQVS